MNYLMDLAYRTEEGKPWVLPVVKKVEKDLAADETQNHEYLPILGMTSFTESATVMLLGKNNSALVEGRVSFFFIYLIINSFNEFRLNHSYLSGFWCANIKWYWRSKGWC